MQAELTSIKEQKESAKEKPQILGVTKQSEQEMELLSKQHDATKEMLELAVAERDNATALVDQLKNEVEVHNKNQMELAKVHAELEEAATTLHQLSQAEISKLTAELDGCKAEKERLAASLSGNASLRRTRALQLLGTLLRHWAIIWMRTQLHHWHKSAMVTTFHC